MRVTMLETCEIGHRFVPSAGRDAAVSPLDEFTKQYIETALWSSTDDEGKPLYRNYSIEDFAPETLRVMTDDAKKFQDENYDDISGDIATTRGTDLELAGHDFWLTRNRHGTGFWDGNWPEAVGKRLTDAAHAYGEMDLYVGDDGMIYHFPGS